MDWIAGGDFTMGAPDDHGEADDRPAHRVRVSSFCLDRTEVTVDAYASCRGCAPAGGGEGCNAGVTGRDLHPINCVTWEDAARYCAARRARLPSEAEWEYAARGAEGRTHPWGEAMPWERLCWDRGESEGTCAVASFPRGATPQGTVDLAGDVSEWVADWFAPYRSGASADPTGPSDGMARVIRGASWDTHDPLAVGAFRRDSGSPVRRRATVGFRCAASP